MLEKLTSVRGNVRAKECAIYERCWIERDKNRKKKRKQLSTKKFQSANQYDRFDARPFWFCPSIRLHVVSNPCIFVNDN